jgi:hypothetical protein
LRDLKLAASAAAAMWLLAACGSCGTPSVSSKSSGPTQAELAAATVSGHWQLTVVIKPYTGPQPPATSAFLAGHKGFDNVVFVSKCSAVGACTLQLWGATGPDPSQQAYYRFYSSTTDLQGPPVSTPMTESGASYSQVIPISGFGGYKCPPSPSVAKPEQRLEITVTGATKALTGWVADRISGEETFIAGWGCGAGGFTGWTVGHLAITGQQIFPPGG